MDGSSLIPIKPTAEGFTKCNRPALNFVAHYTHWVSREKMGGHFKKQNFHNGTLEEQICYLGNMPSNYTTKKSKQVFRGMMQKLKTMRTLYLSTCTIFVPKITLN